MALELDLVGDAPIDHGRLNLERIGDIEGDERRANENILAWMSSSREPIMFRCECGHDDCHAALAVPLGIYEEARRSSMLFLVTPGHQILEAEDVVARADGWEMVRKHEVLREIVERSDPRRD